MEKMVKCKVHYRTGHWETDSLTVTSPTGKSLSLWLHQDGVTEEQWKSVYSIINRYTKVLEAYYAYESAHKPSFDSSEWATYIAYVGKVFGGPFTFLVDITLEEMRHFKEASEVKSNGL